MAVKMRILLDREAREPPSQPERLPPILRKEWNQGKAVYKNLENRGTRVETRYARLVHNLNNDRLLARDNKCGGGDRLFRDHGLTRRFKASGSSIVIERCEYRGRKVGHFTDADDGSARWPQYLCIEPVRQPYIVHGADQFAQIFRHELLNYRILLDHAAVTDKDRKRSGSYA